MTDWIQRFEELVIQNAVLAQRVRAAEEQVEKLEGQREALRGDGVPECSLEAEDG